MQNRQEKAFDYADAAIKQLVTLATAVVGATILIFDNQDMAGVQIGGGYTLVAGLGLTVLSILFGLFAGNRLAGILVEDAAYPVPKISEKVAYRLWALQMISFTVGVALIVVAAFLQNGAYAEARRPTPPLPSAFPESA